MGKRSNAAKRGGDDTSSGSIHGSMGITLGHYSRDGNTNRGLLQCMVQFRAQHSYKYSMYGMNSVS